ncbi:hypothetical protein HUT18_24925 [Streptomyces sp. NA04227]|uniref:hypothetical protein n=1 Tax=Streptomyces sp. NA04227 TaxID=2742136 RepID=UPI0015913879|nr:hypothetical protein [Streptomyces sp. NA04227]QKW04973.1 hypothetical protein HUT18_24925 [Streptomyces sp. NA04227]
MCGNWVGAAVRRHKTLGAYVPLWGTAPCRNPECSAYVDPDEPEPEPHPYHRPDRHQVIEHLAQIEGTTGPYAKHSGATAKGAPKPGPDTTPGAGTSGSTAEPKRRGQEPEAPER